MAYETLYMSRAFDISSQAQSKQKLRKRRRPGIQIFFTVVIFFVLTWRIINEFEKYGAKERRVITACRVYEQNFRSSKHRITKNMLTLVMVSFHSSRYFTITAQILARSFANFYRQ